ncbi:hypothetical protein NDU88_003152 [Pleurodeles waltl]|uniref:Uncharacterized protein n=1 Tax=Pleurodeles waltl TaxID=8319 RepID=A0AAV7MQD7_PLEWA|nr:hypothetical protein NDU88_003152 [Pleurodeles waltl]
MDRTRYPLTWPQSGSYSESEHARASGRLPEHEENDTGHRCSPNPRGGTGTVPKPCHTIEDGLASMAQSVSPAEEQEMGEIATPSMLQLKSFILEHNKAILGRIDGVATTVTLLRQDMDKMEGKVKDLETRADGMEEIVRAPTTTLTEHECRPQMQDAQLSDLEDRLQHNYNPILGLPGRDRDHTD